jgi:hypothetical protein
MLSRREAAARWRLRPEQGQPKLQSGPARPDGEREQREDDEHQQAAENFVGVPGGSCLDGMVHDSCPEHARQVVSRPDRAFSFARVPEMFGNSLCCAACEWAEAHTADSGTRPPRRTREQIQTARGASNELSFPSGRGPDRIPGERGPICIRQGPPWSSSSLSPSQSTSRRGSGSRLANGSGDRAPPTCAWPDFHGCRRTPEELR